MYLKNWLNSKYGLVFHPRTWWLNALHWSCARVVQSGPFAGMYYIGRSVGSTPHPKLLGSYESELHECIEKLCHCEWQSVIDVGAAEGYYAVGFAYRTRCPVTAFEQDPIGRCLLKEMSRSNGVLNLIDIRGNCEPEELNEVLGAKPRSLLIMDVEGYETTLLGDLTLPHLIQATVLVEIHEGIDRAVTSLLSSRFEDSHDKIEFVSRPRTIEDFKGSKWMSLLAFRRAWMTSAMDECRGMPMSWLLFRPRSSFAGSSECS